MYVCLCKGITKKKLEDALKQSNGNWGNSLKILGVGSDCGTCLSDIKQEYLPLANSYKNSKVKLSNKK